MNDPSGNDNALSDALGAVLLISVVALGIAIAGIAILSGPLPDRIPAISAEVTNTSGHVFIRHTGGDTLVRGEYRILVDGADRTTQFLSGSAAPAQWANGDTLDYRIPAGEEMPASVQIVAITGNSEQVIRQVQVLPPAFRPNPSLSPATTASTTATTAVPTSTTVPPPVAGFSASPLTGTRPLAVQFTDASTQSPTSWSWDFGDGSTSMLRSPAHIYTTAGTYTVTLTAANTGGSDAETKTNYISVVNPATSIVKFVLVYAQTASPGLRNTAVPGFDPIPDGAVILPAQYSNEPVTVRVVTDPEPTGSVRLVLSGAASRTQTENSVPYCLFGDDPAGQYNPWIPTPPIYGTYQLTATPYTGSGGTGTAGTPATISFTLAPPPTTSPTPTPTATPPPAPLVANFDWTEDGSSGNVQFTDKSTGSPASWQWNFDDGGSSALQNPKHKFKKGSSYDVILTVTRTSDGAVSSISRQVII